MTEETRGHTYWVRFDALFTESRVCSDVTGYFQDSDEPWTTSEFVQGTPTKDLFQWADDYFVRLAESTHREERERCIKFIGYFDEDWILRDVAVIYDDLTEDEKISVAELLDEDIEKNLALSAERWLRALGDTNAGA